MQHGWSMHTHKIAEKSTYEHKLPGTYRKPTNVVGFYLHVSNIILLLCSDPQISLNIPDLHQSRGGKFCLSLGCKRSCPSWGQSAWSGTQTPPSDRAQAASHQSTRWRKDEMVITITPIGWCTSLRARKQYGNKQNGIGGWKSHIQNKNCTKLSPLNPKPSYFTLQSCTCTYTILLPACLVPLLLGKTTAFVHWLAMNQLRGEHSGCCQLGDNAWDRKNGVTRQNLPVVAECAHAASLHTICKAFTNVSQRIAWEIAIWIEFFFFFYK